MVCSCTKLPKDPHLKDLRDMWYRLLRIAALTCFISIPFLHDLRAQSADTNTLTILHPAEANDSDIAVPSGEFSIQVGAFSRKKNAERLSKKFRADGWDVDLFENVLDKTRTFYLVWIGSYPSLDEAHQQQSAIEERYKIHGVIRQRIGWQKR